MKEKYRQFYRSFHKGFQDRDPNVYSVLVDDGGVEQNRELKKYFMNIFRLFLLIIALSVIGYTLPVIQSEGILILLPTFFGEMNNLNWQGQFNLDFLTFLLMSAFWTAWRNKFTLRGNLLAIGAFFLGAPYLAIYLIYLSFVCEGDIKLMLLGER